MLDFIRMHQQNILLSLASICGITALFIILSGNLSRKRKFIILYMDLAAMFMLLSDRYAYIFRGDSSATGYWMVRITNFLTFFLLLAVEHALNLFLSDLFVHEGGYPSVPMRFRICEILISVGELLIIVSQFTGLYYTFDENNIYQRAPGYTICYLIPMGILIVHLTLVIQSRMRFRRGIRFSLYLYALLPIMAAVAQAFLYGLSLINMSVAVVTVVLYVFVLSDMNQSLARANHLEIEFLREEQKSVMRLFDQTATSLVSAIDAKDKYTHGHSARVADYARKIAELSGCDEKECEEIYYAALLHDVGKIGIPDSIINKSGELTPEEYELVKQHTAIGRDILSRISEYPYLSIGAYYHHERFDGRGYPDHLKGQDIPKIARIITVADAYDVMTSKRSYRDPIPQQTVREEFVRDAGSQFDPEYARIMQHIIDKDTEYQMKEKQEVRELAGKGELHCRAYRSEVSEGFAITSAINVIRLKCAPADPVHRDTCMPAIVLFDSLDGRVYADEKRIRELNYFEYGEVWFDGHTVCSGARKIQGQPLTGEAPAGDGSPLKSGEYEVEMAKYRDHVRIRIRGGNEPVEIIMALPDASRFVYAAVTGENCSIRDVQINTTGEEIDAEDIPRIAEEVSYINRLEGDVPNVQIDGYRTAATEGIPIVDGLKLQFHTMSLPTARLVWHCAYIDVFHSEDKKIDGPGYREYALIRLDGESWDEAGDAAENVLLVNKNDTFDGWEAWKEKNKAGMECEVTFSRKGDRIVTVTENMGILIKNTTTILDGTKDIYVALTGDQCALTDIRIL